MDLFMDEFVKNRCCVYYILVFLFYKNWEMYHKVQINSIHNQKPPAKLNIEICIAPKRDVRHTTETTHLIIVSPIAGNLRPKQSV